MASNIKCLSQIWNKSSLSDVDQQGAEQQPIASGSRRQLSRQFKSASDNSQQNHGRLLRSRGVLSSINLPNVGNVPKETRKLLQAGAEKANQTFNDVCSAFGACLQKLKKPTRRRQRLVSSPYTPNRVKGTPKSKQILGRTPTKLYSPFGIETPSDRRQRQHQSLYGKPGSYTPTRSGSNNKRMASKSMSTSSFDASTLYSPTQALPKDVQHVRQGVADFNRAAEGVVRRSLRNQLSAAQI